MSAYYNEIDPFAAKWLRNLIAAGHIAPGDVDQRDIRDVRPDDIRGYTQCHFFAGVGVWSYALRRAGWSDDRPVWTGSCPCQPFSAAGAGAGFSDERHLWPHFHWLIQECRPASVLGEQVAGKDAEPWIDLVQADMEAMDYAFGAVPFPSASVGAPHIRDRLYWVADSAKQRRNRRWAGEARDGRDAARIELERFRAAGRMADANRTGCDTWGKGCATVGHRSTDESDSSLGRMADTHCPGPFSGALAGIYRGEEGPGTWDGEPERFGAAGVERPGPINGFWRNADWLLCRDGKWRPVEPGTFPLAHGPAGGVGRVRADQERLDALRPRKDQGSRAGRLRAYGNAINAEAARVFVECVMEELR